MNPGFRGDMAEWLRRGLQILAPRFDSGCRLQLHLLSGNKIRVGKLLGGISLMRLLGKAVSIWFV